MDNDSIKGAYKRYAPVYDWVFGLVFRNGRHVAMDSLEFESGDHVLELGVGTGLSLPEYPDDVDIHVTGVDISQDMLDKAEKRIQKHGLTNCELYNMDAEALDFPDNSFDKIMVLYVLSVVPDPYKVMSEVRRVAKPGADVIFVNHFAKENPLVRRFESALSRWAAPLGFDPDFPMEPVLENVGLNVERIESVNLFGYWTMLHGRCPQE